MTHPFVSVVVLNYNGRRFLEDCLSSLTRLDYPPDRYELVLVDNVSRDGSADMAAQRFPGVRLIRNSRNLGFAAGNNVALRGSRADYLVLLNNDTRVEPGWLNGLVEAAEADPSIGACTSKLVFQHDRARLTLKATPFRPREYGSADQRELGVRVLEAAVSQGEESRPAEYLEGFHGAEPSSRGVFQWSSAEGTLGLRLKPEGGDATLYLAVAAPRPDGSTATLRLEGDGQPLGEWQVGSELVRLEVPLPQTLLAGATRVIQNAGTLVLGDGSGQDRGSLVRGTEVFQEDDRGQYDRQEEVFAGCGAALLFRRTALEDVGLFDEDFFMYYEDMDLSWRLRRRGWKIVYVPNAVVRHLHAASSVEWSPLFIYNVERNRLLMLAKNAPARLALSEHARYAASAAANSARLARCVALRSPDWKLVARRGWIQARVLASLLGQLPRTLGKRRDLRRRDRISPSEMVKWMVSA